MKVVFVVVVLVCFRASLLYADVAFNQSHDTTEVLLITANVGASFVNVAMAVAHDPEGWAVGFGAAAGLTSIIYAATAENVERGTELSVTGLAAICTGILSLGFRDEHRHARVEPDRRKGSSGLALVVDF